MTMVLFNSQTNNKEYQFTPGMWPEEPGVTKILFDT